MPPSVFKEQNNCKIYACTLYDEITKKLIKDLKYHNKKILASLQAKIMYEYWLDLHKKKIFLFYLYLSIKTEEKKENIIIWI